MILNSNAKFKFVSFELISTFWVIVQCTRTDKMLRCQSWEGNFLGDHFQSHDKWALLISEETDAQCHVLSGCQSLPTLGSFRVLLGERGVDGFYYFRVFRHWNQRPNNKQTLLFKVKFILFAQYTCRLLVYIYYSGYFCCLSLQ